MKVAEIAFINRLSEDSREVQLKNRLDSATKRRQKSHERRVEKFKARKEQFELKRKRREMKESEERERLQRLIAEKVKERKIDR